MSDVNSPEISVITPAYNAEKLIGQTIQSVVNQTFTNWELIIVDDCSTDETLRVARSWAESDSRIIVKTVDRNFGGPAGPRNVGVESASGKFVAFLDADDIWHPRKLELQIKVLQDQNVDFVCSKMRDFTSEEDLEFVKVDSFEVETVSFGQQSLRARIPTSSVVARRELLRAHPFREDIGYKAVEDYHCWLRLLQSTPKCVKVGVPLLCYRKIEGQISGSKLYMMRKVFMVHREYPDRSWLSAVFFTFCHVFGGVYFRFVKKGM